MKKSLLVTLLVTILLCIIGFNQTVITNSTYTEGTSALSQSYTISAPMDINSNSDFATEGWSGSGIIGDPYLIESLEFNDTINGACISISSTTAFFRIVNCLFSPAALGNALEFNNVHNGLISDCSTTSTASLINVYGSTTIEIRDCMLSGTCAVFENSADCNISSCSIEGAPGDGIYLVNCDNIRIGECTISNNAASGISLQITDNTLIVNNVIRDNSLEQISITGSSSGNRIYNNEIHVGTMTGALDNGEDNYWDDSVSIGNLWSDYDGSGTYEISGTANSIDHFPRDTSTPLTPTTNTTGTTSTTLQPGEVSVTSWAPMDLTIRIALVVAIGVSYGVLVILAIKYFILK